MRTNRLIDLRKPFKSRNGHQYEPEENSNRQSIEFRCVRRFHDSRCEQINSRSEGSGDNARRERATFWDILVDQLGSEIRRQ